jgi:hypothetical protein
MEPDNTLATVLDNQNRIFDPRRQPVDPPDTGPFDLPLHAVQLNHAWWTHLTGMAGRLLYADAWLGTDEEKADAVQNSLLCIDEIQRGSSNVLPGWEYDWPGTISDPTLLWEVMNGSYNSSQGKFHDALDSGGKWNLYLQARVPLLVTQVEIDSMWGTGTGATVSLWRVLNDGATRFTQDLAPDGNTTLVYLTPGISVESHLEYDSVLQLYQRLQPTVPANPHYINWTGIRIYGYGLNPNDL